jgi:hypothetical protein
MFWFGFSHGVASFSEKQRANSSARLAERFSWQNFITMTAESHYRHTNNFL